VTYTTSGRYVSVACQLAIVSMNIAVTIYIYIYMHNHCCDGSNEGCRVISMLHSNATEQPNLTWLADLLAQWSASNFVQRMRSPVGQRANMKHAMGCTGPRANVCQIIATAVVRGAHSHCPHHIQGFYDAVAPMIILGGVATTASAPNTSPDMGCHRQTMQMLEQYSRHENKKPTVRYRAGSATGTQHQLGQLPLNTDLLEECFSGSCTLVTHSTHSTLTHTPSLTNTTSQPSRCRLMVTQQVPAAGNTATTRMLRQHTGTPLQHSPTLEQASTPPLTSNSTSPPYPITVSLQPSDSVP
jgi:hypothetical protein